MKKTKQPILYVLSSLSSWIVDTGLYYLFLGLFGQGAVTLCNVLARVFSSFYNYNFNNRLVFRSKEPYGKSLLRYYLLAIPQLLASTVLLNLFVSLFSVESREVSTVIKIVVDGFLFVASFFIQKYWVFAKGKKED